MIIKVQGPCLRHHLPTVSAALKAYGQAGIQLDKTLFCAHSDYRPLRLSLSELKSLVTIRGVSVSRTPDKKLSSGMPERISISERSGKNLSGPG